MPINGETALLAVIGHPVKHSLSPHIQNHFIEATRLPYAYLAFDIEPGQVKEFARASLLLGMAGFNVTMPFKEEIIPCIDVMDSKAAMYGAVNTVVVRERRLYGYNTDGDGFLLSLAHHQYQLTQGKALILGAGGAARTVAMALAQNGVNVCVAARRPEEAKKMMERSGLALNYCHWDAIRENAADCSLIVNGTPLGMHGTDKEFDDLSFLDMLPSGAFVYDLIYAPRETKFLSRAKNRGLTAVNGLSHLICQAALAYALFTGIMPDQAVMDGLALS